MKTCSRCVREHDTAFKTCSKCREYFRDAQKKRKRLAKDIKVPDGSRVCKQCSHTKPESDFKSNHSRRKKLTAHCRSCRDILAKTAINPTTTTGKCRAYWILWRKMQICKDCGYKGYKVMEADHLGTKVHKVSDYPWWAYHGGVEAMKKELETCQPLCKPCHRMVTKKRHEEKLQQEGRTLKPCIIRRRAMIDQKKVDIGECKTCKKVVTLERACTFDFDHLIEKDKKISISQIVKSKEETFQHFFKTEIPKCQLLCSICHHLKTFYKT